MTSSIADNGTSVFDPCLCELMYLWFTKGGDAVLDPFAGGSVRGIVAELMGRAYTGVELRPEQVDANREQAARLCARQPTWIVGDSMQINEIASGDYDFILTCPPYADLEVYSDDPADLSNMPYDEFAQALRLILGKSVGMLRPDRFAAIVIGDVRDEAGFLRGLPALVVSAMEDGGARYYNEAVLATQCGSAPIRARAQFEKSRKLVKTHQDVLVFCTGDPVLATERLGKVSFADYEALWL